MLVRYARDWDRRPILASDQSPDDKAGTVVDLYFDDEMWWVRYLVVRIGKLIGHKVLVPPQAIRWQNLSEGILQAHMSLEELENSPGIQTDQPISRQEEERQLAYYGLAPYWGGAALAVPAMVDQVHQDMSEREDEQDTHLRSVQEIRGYEVDALDGPIGKVEDIILNDQTYRIHNLCIEAKDSDANTRIFCPPFWIDTISWSERCMQLGVDSQQIEHSPRVTQESQATGISLFTPV